MSIVQRIKQEIPNAFTLGNFACGLLSIHYSTLSESSSHDFLVDLLLLASFGFILLGALFDVFDGMLARKLGVAGPFGLQLDSLADVVTFGVAPYFLFINFMFSDAGAHKAFYNDDTIEMYVLIIALFHPLLAAYRLATFNISTDQSKDFIGLPSPAAGILLASSPMLFMNLDLHSPWLLVVPIFTGCLMVSKLSFFSFKGLGNPLVRIYGLVLVVCAGISLYYVEFGGISLTIFAYICLSIVYHIQKKERT